MFSLQIIFLKCESGWQTIDSLCDFFLSPTIIQTYYQSSVNFYKSPDTSTRLLLRLVQKFGKSHIIIGKSHIFGGDPAAGVPQKFVANPYVRYNGGFGQSKIFKNFSKSNNYLFIQSKKFICYLFVNQFSLSVDTIATFQNSLINFLFKILRSVKGQKFSKSKSHFLFSKV